LGPFRADRRGSSAAGGGASDASDPGFVTCGDAPCSVPDHYCCDTPSSETCVPNTVSGCAGERRLCDEAADCPVGQVCCVPFAEAPFFVHSTLCSTSCDRTGLQGTQVCKTDSECKNAQPCQQQTCSGKVVRACEQIDPNFCN
jgi:hypothetical protein